MNQSGQGDYSQYYEQYWNNYAAWGGYGAGGQQYYDPYSYGDMSGEGMGMDMGQAQAKDSSKEDFEPVGGWLDYSHH